MCEYISFAIGVKDHNFGDIYFGERPNSHSGIESKNKILPDSYRECEWTENDKGQSLVIRVDKENKNTLKKWILKEYPKRELIEQIFFSQIKNKVGGDLDLNGCTGITSLPADLEVLGRIIR